MMEFAYAALYLVPFAAMLYIIAQRAAPRAVAIAVIGSWLAMPLLRFDPPGLPMIDKETLVGGAAFVGVWFGRPEGLRVRIRWFDWPILFWCVSPVLSSLANGLGFMDGISGSLRGAVCFAAPWAVGRMVFTDGRALVEFGRVLLLGACAYAPLCLIESRLAPRLHEWVFGVPGRVGYETVDFWGPLRFKASVFLQSPLELTPLMGAGCLFGWWLYYRMRERRIAGHDVRVLAAIATFSMLMGKSLGGAALTAMAAGALWATQRLRTRLVFVGLMSIVPLYIGTRASGAWDALDFVNFLQEHISERRAESFKVRIDNENLLVAKALESPVFGWGGWGRNHVYDEEGKDISITDGFWIIALGTYGWFGLASWLIVLLVPFAFCLGRNWPAVLRARGEAAIVPCALIIVLMHALDSMGNAMANPIYYALAGGLTSIGSLAIVARTEPQQALAALPRQRNLEPRHPIASPQG
jgi:hypothetical protein